MKILVTEGAGFIGSSVTDRLLERGDRVVCLDNFDDFYKPEIKKRNIDEALKNPGFKLVADDITLAAAGRKLLNRLKNDSVLITRGEHGMSLFQA